MYYVCRQIAVLRYGILRNQCTNCIKVSTLQFAAWLMQLTEWPRFDVFFHFEIKIFQMVNFFLPSSRKFVFAISSPIECLLLLAFKCAFKSGFSLWAKMLEKALNAFSQNLNFLRLAVFEILQFKVNKFSSYLKVAIFSVL